MFSYFPYLWQEALELICKRSTEENWLRNTFGTDEMLWMGFSDAAVDGQWEWVSGEAVTYTNWSTNEGGISPQDYGVMNFGDQWDDAYGNGTWDAHGTWLDGLRGIIEINTTSNDTLVGGIGHDTLYGNAGDDTLYGDELPSEGNSTLTNGLVGHWAFDETAGSVASDATGNHTGTLTNMSNQWTSGQLEGALTFDGHNQRVMIPDANELDITDTLTLTTWVKVDTFESWAGLIVKGTSNIPYGLDLRSDGRLIFQGNYGGVSGGGVAVNGPRILRLRLGNGIMLRSPMMAVRSSFIWMVSWMEPIRQILRLAPTINLLY